MNNFSDLSLDEKILSALKELKLEKPTETQKKTIPLLLEKKDIMVCAATGSGKTAAFSIPMLQHLLQSPGKSALVLAPTRELAHQISDFLRELIKFAPKFRVCLLYTSPSPRDQRGSRMPSSA